VFEYIGPDMLMTGREFLGRRSGYLLFRTCRYGRIIRKQIAGSFPVKTGRLFYINSIF